MRKNADKGYAGRFFNKLVDVPPPTLSIPMGGEENTPIRGPFPRVPELTEHEARQALLNYVSHRYCYGKGAAKEMTITKIDNSCAFHYTLESFCERRQTCWVFEPYGGGHVDGASYGPPPQIWDVAAPPPDRFQNHSTSLQVPHTEVVKVCHSCGGVGRKKCFTCTGTGWEMCLSCQGDGYKPHPFIIGENEKCYQCNMMGRRRCWKCVGECYIPCQGCLGRGQIKCFIRLIISWSNHVDDHIVHDGPVPDDCIKLVSGEVLFEEEQPRLWPINHFPDPTINYASTKIVLKHAESYFTQEKLLYQVRCVFIRCGMSQSTDILLNIISVKKSY